MPRAILILRSLGVLLIISGLIATLYTETIIGVTNPHPVVGMTPIPQETITINKHPYSMAGIGAILIGALALIIALAYLQKHR